MSQRLLLSMFLIAILLITTTSNSVESWSDSSRSTSIERDYWPTDGWRNATPESQGMDSFLLQDMMDFIEDGHYAVDGIVIIRNGYVVFEEYLSEYFGRETKHELYSVTKSFTSTLMGIAIQQGLVNGVNDLVLDYFPERTFANSSDWKNSMTIEDLLTMRSGLDWDEWTHPFTDPRNDYNQIMFVQTDPVGYILNKSMASEPGTDWVYCSGASHLLSTIISKTSGNSTLDFAMQHLFGPLGIDDVAWSTDFQAVNLGGSHLRLKRLDMAKFGYLYLNNGTWDGIPILSEDWVSNVRESISSVNSEVGYSYQWWNFLDHDIFYATGLYGQQIHVIPDYDMVVVFTAGIMDGNNPERTLLFDYILSSVDNNVSPSSPDLMPLVLIAAPVALVSILWYIRRR